MTGEDLAGALHQARMGSRWVVAYAQRVQSLVRAFGDGVREGGPRGADGGALMRFLQWVPVRHNPPPSGATDPTSRWAWDFFPLLAFTTWWVSHAQTHPGAAKVALRISLDDGWTVDGNKQPDPTAFPSDRDAQSQVAAWAYIIRSGGDGPWDSLHPHLKCRGLASRRSGVFDGEVHAVDAGTVVFFYRQVQVGLHELPDRIALEARLISPIVEALDLCNPSGSSKT